MKNLADLAEHRGAEKELLDFMRSSDNFTILVSRLDAEWTVQISMAGLPCAVFRPIPGAGAGNTLGEALRNAVVQK